MAFLWTLLLAIIAYGLFFLLRLFIRRHLVQEYETGLLYKHGAFVKELSAGAYWLNPMVSKLTVVDKRKTSYVIGGQETATLDNIGVKISLVAQFEIEDAQKAHQSVQSYHLELHTLAQIALREDVSGHNLDDLLENRLDLGKRLSENIIPQASELGLKIHSVHVRDFMLNNDIKKSFSELLKARKAGEAALERARGETAALRKLANAAKMIDKNPNLLALRLTQAMEQSQGHTFSLDLKQLKPEPETETSS